ncbi:MAG TPA: ABC transporter ATP-binding protein [Gemmatimonadota bacterium]|nr:ABC transporter ATP-binding protein [Gemmatimonadota bacterium]
MTADPSHDAAVRSPAIQASELCKSYGKTPALRGASLTVPEGAFFLLVGPNGAGKTTTMRLLSGLDRLDAGELRVFGLDPAAEEARVRAQIGHVPEDGTLGPAPGRMRVAWLLEHQAAYRPSWDRAYEARLCRALEIRRDRRFGDLSKGQARRVQLVMALAHRPPLLLLDEPTDGLDPVVRERTLALLADHLSAMPTTVLLSTHHPHEAEKLADHVGVMMRGRVHFQGPRSVVSERVKRYRVLLPESGMDVSPPISVVRSRRSGRSASWVAWGAEADNRSRLVRAGIEIRSVETLTLEEATLAMLSEEES